MSPSSGIHRRFLFGATDKIDEITSRWPNLPPILILRLRNMTAIDSTGLQALEGLTDQVHESGRKPIFCGAREQPSRLMHQSEFQQHIRAKNMCSSIAEALNRARMVFPEASKHHPVGKVWGSRSADDLEDPEPVSASKETS